MQDGFALTVQLHIVARCLHPSDVGQGHEAELFGYARRYIRRGSPLRTMLTEAVFPFYIVHQTAIVLAGHWLKPLGLPVLVEAGTILAASVAVCLGAYGLARTVPWLRLPLGLKPQPRAPQARPSAQPAA